MIRSLRKAVGWIPALILFFYPFWLVPDAVAQSPSHPHLVARQIDVDKIYSKILAHEEPWYSQYLLVAAEADSVRNDPILWIDDKIRQYDWEEYKLKADLGCRRIASLTFAFLYSKSPLHGQKLRSHLLGWCDEAKLAVVDEYFPNWNHSHPVATLAILVSLAYDLNEPSGIFSQQEQSQIRNWLAAAVQFIKERHELNIYWSNQKAWNNAALLLSAFLLGDTALADLILSRPEYAIGTSQLIAKMIQSDGQICDFWQGCYSIWHSLLTLNAFALVASSAYEHGYANIFLTEPQLPLSFSFFAPLFITNDAASLGPGYSMSDSPYPYHIFFSGIYEIAHKLAPENQVFKEVLLHPDFNYTTGRFCRNYRAGDSCYSCSRWIKFPVLLWGQEINYARVEAKILLEGFHSGEGLMHCSLRQMDLLPNRSPYADAPKQVTHLPEHVVDWVKVTLRDSVGTVVARASAFLNAHGEVIEIDGNKGISFPVAPGAYWLVIDHRTHLPLQSAEPLTLHPEQTAFVDLTQATNLPANAAVREIEPGISASRCGDINQDDQVTTGDQVIWQGDWFGNEAAYLSSDLNGDGHTDLMDYEIWRAAASSGAAGLE